MTPKIPSIHGMEGKDKRRSTTEPLESTLSSPAHRRTTRKECLLYAAGMLFSMTAAMLAWKLLRRLGAVEYVGGFQSAPAAPLAERSYTTLQEMPADDRQMAARLFRYISQPSSLACGRQIRFGGSPRYSPQRWTYLEGDQVACLDRSFSLNKRQCLVYSVRHGGDTSLETALHRFGCEVHTFDDSSVPEDPPYTGARVGRPGSPILHRESVTDVVTVAHLRYRLGHTHQPIAFLSVTAPGVEDAVLEHPEALQDVEQLALRLHFTDALPNGRDRTVTDTFALFRRRYRQLLQLQQAGFRPFAFGQMDSHGAINMTIAGLTEPLTSVQEVVLLNTSLL